MNNIIEKIIQNSYDSVPYPSNPFPQSHPDRLATIASLLGMEPAPVEHCRVLELGCASGGNVVPMAQGLSESEFIGLDFSAQQIAAGQVMIDTLGLKNIRLKHTSILDVNPDFGQFDYIIAHGVYSWVPAEVQDKVLEICRQNLAPQGVAYISYNTYPGWHTQGTIRDMMRYHTRNTTEPKEQIAQARALLEFLGESIQGKGNPHAEFLHDYVHYVKDHFLPQNDDAYLFHNELSAVNEPLYFHQFVSRAAQHNLRYLAEAQFQTMLADNLSGKVSAKLRQMVKDTIALEQYMDFLRNRMFRQTLLCHQEVQLQSKLTPERLAKFYMASAALPESPNLDIRSQAIDKFCAPNGDTLATDHPVTKAAMSYLSEIWPQAVSFKILLSTAYARLNGGLSPYNGLSPSDIQPDASTDMQVLGANLLKAYSHNEDLIEFHVHAPRFTKEISERPVVSPLARYQAQKRSRITNLRHELIDLDGLNGYLVLRLDGTLSRAALLDMLEMMISEGAIEVALEDQSLKGAKHVRDALPEMLDSALQSLANAALLVG